ncbi:hypothetical protein ACWC5I_46420, partial [Kitasatospora sp. NPDC001574]
TAMRAAGTTVRAARIRFTRETGEALAAIRGDQLYQYADLPDGEQPYASFEDYALRRYGLSLAHAKRLADAAPILLAMAPIGAAIGVDATESHARELVQLHKAQGDQAVQQVYQAVLEKTDKPTAKVVAAVREKLFPGLGPLPDDQEQEQAGPDQEPADPLAAAEATLAALQKAKKALQPKAMRELLIADPARYTELLNQIKAAADAVAGAAGRAPRISSDYFHHAKDGGTLHAWTVQSTAKNPLLLAVVHRPDGTWPAAPGGIGACKHARDETDPCTRTPLWYAGGHGYGVLFCDTHLPEALRPRTDDSAEHGT